MHALLVFACLSLGAPVNGKAWDVIEAIVNVVESDKREPITENKELDAVVMLVYAWEESRFEPRANGDCGTLTWPEQEPKCESRGVWQLRYFPDSIRLDVRKAAKAWYDVAQAGKKYCRPCPLAPLTGGCKHAEKVANQRVKLAKALLDSALQARTLKVNEGCEEGGNGVYQ